MGRVAWRDRIADPGFEYEIMKITPEDLKASYRRMSDEELLAIDRGELTDVARQCYDDEAKQRGLAVDAEVAELAAGAEFDEPLLAIRNCSSADEAWAVVSALEGAGIPARVVVDESVRAAEWLRTGLGRYPVAVPASRAEEARDFLNAESPDAIIVEARYENGVFRPLEEIALPAGTVVEVHVPAEAFGAEES
jgi:Protein of unknown function DUF104